MNVFLFVLVYSRLKRQMQQVRLFPTQYHAVQVSVLSIVCLLREIIHTWRYLTPFYRGLRNRPFPSQSMSGKILPVQFCVGVGWYLVISSPEHEVSRWAIVISHCPSFLGGYQQFALNDQFQSNHRILPRWPSTEIAKMVLLRWTGWLLELKIKKYIYFALLLLN